MSIFRNIGIFQGAIIDTTFQEKKFVTKVPYYNSDPMDREINIYRPIIEKNLHKDFDYCGIISKSFEAKVGLDLLSIKKIISEQESDIYIFSPHQYEEKVWQNIWDQTFIFHEKSISLIQQTLKKIDYPILTNKDLTKTPWCFSHFWFAKTEIFEDIAKDLILINKEMKKNLLNQNKVPNYQAIATPSNGELKKNYILRPFAMERIVGYLIKKMIEKNKKLYIYKDPRNVEKSMHLHLNLLNKSYLKIIQEKSKISSNSYSDNNLRKELYSEYIFTKKIRDIISKYCDTEFTIEKLKNLINSQYF